MTGKMLRPAQLILGAMTLVAWVAMIVSLFAGVDVEDAGLTMTIALLVVVVLSAACTYPSASRAKWVASGGAALYAGIFAYLRLGFDRMMPDAVLYAITALFYLSPVVTAVATLVAGARGRR